MKREKIVKKSSGKGEAERQMGERGKGAKKGGSVPSEMTELPREQKLT